MSPNSEKLRFSNPEKPGEEKPEWEERLEKVQRESFLGLKKKARNNELKEDEEEELNRRKDMIYNIFFGKQGFLKERENFENKNLRTDYDAALESLSQNLQKDFLKVPGLTWKDLKEKIFEKDKEAIEIENMGEKISQNKKNKEKVKDELMDYLERKINEILEEKAKKPPEQKEKVQKEKEESEAEFIEKNYLADSAENLGKKLKEAPPEELEKWQEAIRRHNEEVRKKVERAREKARELGKPEPQIFHYKLSKKGETEEEAKEREEHNKKEFEKFLEYYKGLLPDELEKRGWTKNSTEGEEFLKFVKDKWNEMWRRAVRDVEEIKNKKELDSQPQPRKETVEKRAVEPAPERVGDTGRERKELQELTRQRGQLEARPREVPQERVPGQKPKKKWFGLVKELMPQIVTGLGTLGGAIVGGLALYPIAVEWLGAPLWWPVLGTLGFGLIGGLVTWGLYEQISKHWNWIKEKPLYPLRVAWDIASFLSSPFRKPLREAKQERRGATSQPVRKGGMEPLQEGTTGSPQPSGTPEAETVEPSSRRGQQRTVSLQPPETLSATPEAGAAGEETSLAQTPEEQADVNRGKTSSQEGGQGATSQQSPEKEERETSSQSPESAEKSS